MKSRGKASLRGLEGPRAQLQGKLAQRRGVRRGGGDQVRGRKRRGRRVKADGKDGDNCLKRVTLESLP